MQKPLGQVLMEAGMLAVEEINEALEIQKSTGQRPGDILINLEIITPEKLELAADFQSVE